MIYMIKNNTTFYSIFTGFFLFFFVSLTKTTLGPDEETYLRVGTIFLNEGAYTYTKAHPLLSVLSAFIFKIFQDSLLTYQIIYGLSGMLLSFSVIKILDEILIDKSNIKFIHTFILLTPGILVLCLYAISNIFFTSIAYASVYFFYKCVKDRSTQISVIAGFIVGLSYLARVDGIVLFFGLCLSLLILSYLNNESYKKIFLYFASTFFITIIPWQIYLNSNDLLLSSVIRGGYASGYWDDGIAKYVLGDGTRIGFEKLNFFNHFFVPTAKNLVLYSENISSIKSFPFFLWVFILFCFDEIKNKYNYIIFIIPFLTTFSYLIFFIETRYLVAAVPLLSAMSFIGFINVIKKYFTKKDPYIYSLLAIIVIMDLCFILLWMN
jgi:hypothetical protein